MKEMFTKSIPAEVQSEMLDERRFEGLRAFMKAENKIWTEKKCFEAFSNQVFWLEMYSKAKKFK